MSLRLCQEGEFLAGVHWTELAVESCDVNLGDHVRTYSFVGQRVRELVIGITEQVAEVLELLDCTETKVVNLLPVLLLFREFRSDGVFQGYHRVLHFSQLESQLSAYLRWRG